MILYDTLPCGHPIIPISPEVCLGDDVLYGTFPWSRPEILSPKYVTAALFPWPPFVFRYNSFHYSLDMYNHLPLATADGGMWQRGAVVEEL